MISLYVHPVVVNHDNERATPIKRRSDQERHLAEAELRNVYTCFITPLIDYQLTGNEEKDKMLYDLLNDIMNLCTRELHKVQGHLRQFILDDKGLVLICTFGLRGSTFPNMIAQRAVPFSISMHKALEDELGIKSLIGATFGKAYCGVVGGLERHEFAVLGPSVNLSARLMASKGNPGILVDKNVRLLTSQVFFKPLPAVKAKGYDEPVPIFEPRKRVVDDEWGHAKRNFIGREDEVKQIMHIAKDMMYQTSVTKMCFVSAMSGSGKS
jgi:class 3 adenylate cyclase